MLMTLLFLLIMKICYKKMEILFDYCTSWKLNVITNKTKIMFVGEGGGILSRDLHFLHSGEK